MSLPTPTTAVFVASSSVSIPNISPITVFKGLTDLSSYSWCSFTPAITVKKSPRSEPFALDDGLLALPIGTKLTLQVTAFTPKKLPIYQKEVVSQWDVQNRKIAWAQDMIPHFLLRSERVQEVFDDGHDGSIYRTTIVSLSAAALIDTGRMRAMLDKCNACLPTVQSFSGILSHMVKAAVGSKVQQMMDQCSADVRHQAAAWAEQDQS